MEENELDKLKIEIADLKKEVDAIKKSQGEDIRRVARALKIFKQQRDQDFEQTHKLIKDVYTSAYQRIANLHDIVSPIENKIFPRAKDTRRQMKTIIGPKNLFGSAKWDKKEDKKKD